MSRRRAVGMAVASPVTSFRVAIWTWSAARGLERSLRMEGMAAVAGIRPPPAVAARHRSTVSGLLRIKGATCLVRSAVLQRWDADHDRPRPIVIGVARGADGFTAHAWLEGERSGNGFVELHRRPPAV